MKSRAVKLQCDLEEHIIGELELQLKDLKHLGILALVPHGPQPQPSNILAKAPVQRLPKNTAVASQQQRVAPRTTVGKSELTGGEHLG